ncbi:MAG: 16S rRNA (cytosine(967)-C(5))-methyltransferase RsmB, partial [Mannheimia varigena]|nr:16S rRNA (cytosine(967)-C(5))-methyltransferase RsmB [Mannheimia varigena]
MKKQSTKALSSRAVSATIILQVLDQGKSLSTLIPGAQKQLDPKDFPLVQEITFGVCRVLPRLESIIKLLVEKPLKGKTRLVHCLLLVGLYQLLYMRVPPHAAVDEVVNATKALKLDSFRALTNGVLRRFLREQDEILAKVDKHWQTLHPEWLVNKLKKAYPHWREIVEANNQRPPMWIRVNQQHIKAKDYAVLLGDLVAKNPQNMSACSPHCALLLDKPVGVNQLHNFEQGWATVQDVHAQWSAELLGAENGELILDACAAPGGKTTHILEKTPNAKVIALDIEESRLNRVRENLARLQQTATVICGDA